MPSFHNITFSMISLFALSNVLSQTEHIFDRFGTEKKNEISEISFNLYVCHLKGPYYRENNMSSSTNERNQVTFEFQDFIKALSLFPVYYRGTAHGFAVFLSTEVRKFALHIINKVPMLHNTLLSQCLMSTYSGQMS